MSASLYIGETVHLRQGPRPHGFRYRLFQLLIDIDRVDEDLAPASLIRHGRFGLFSFTERDHGWRDGRSLRSWVETRLADARVEATAHRIRLLTFPRVLGFVFNPISLFYVEAENGELEAIIYEVNSTFRQTHAYVAAASGKGWQRQTARKRLFVSPFYDMLGSYRFDVSPPTTTLNLSITKSNGAEPEFTATLDLARRRLSNRRMLGLFFSMPLMTLKVVAAIHWEALRLFLKGIPLVRRPTAPDVGVSRAALVSRRTGRNSDTFRVTEGSADDDDGSYVRENEPRAGAGSPAPRAGSLPDRRADLRRQLAAWGVDLGSAGRDGSPLPGA